MAGRIFSITCDYQTELALKIIKEKAKEELRTTTYFIRIAIQQYAEKLQKGKI